ACVLGGGGGNSSLGDAPNGAVGATARSVPHSAQNFAPVTIAAPQLTQNPLAPDSAISGPLSVQHHQHSGPGSEPFVITLPTFDHARPSVLDSASPLVASANHLPCEKATPAIWPGG